MTNNDTDTAQEEPVFLEFSGNPKKYKKLSIQLGVGASAYLYLGMFIINFLIRGETWILGWKPILTAIVFAVFCSRFTFKRIMLLDAQYGSGKGWELPRHMVKLPRRRERPKK